MTGSENPRLEQDVEVELPEYDLRRLMTARDALCSVKAFKVGIYVVIAGLYGLRMCPDCPHCALDTHPCVDSFGSNATPMGGSMGRADALIGATEAQKAEGVLHLHFFIYLQMCHQFLNIAEIAALLRAKMLSVETFKTFVSHYMTPVTTSITNT